MDFEKYLRVGALALALFFVPVSSLFSAEGDPFQPSGLMRNLVSGKSKQKVLQARRTDVNSRKSGQRLRLYGIWGTVSAYKALINNRILSSGDNYLSWSVSSVKSNRVLLKSRAGKSRVLRMDN